MTAGKAREPIDAKHVRLVLTDLPRHHSRRTLQLLTKPADGVLGNVVQIRIATLQQIGARLPDHVLQSLRGHIDTRQGHHETQPTRVPLPGLATEDLRRSGLRAIGSSSTRCNHQRADHDDDSGREQRDQNECLGRDGLDLDEGKGDARVGEGKGVVAGVDLGESIADQSDDAVLRLVHFQRTWRTFH